MDCKTHTAGGLALNTGAPQLGDITLADIAHHLAIQTRFCGATARPYSMAEHCLLIVDILERAEGLRDPCGLLAALLSYGHAAYLGDPDTPAARQGAALFEIESMQLRVQATILKVFGLRTAAAAYAARIREADAAAVMTARRDLMPGCKIAPLEAAPAAWLDLRARDHMMWNDWRDAFADRADEFIYARLERQIGEGAT